jgi:uncharacterized protein YbjT (DUF2867 family)
MIFVSGAPGNVGTELVRRLSARGEQVSVLVHNPANADRLRSFGADVVCGDLADPASFVDSLAGADRVFVNSSVGPAIRAQMNLIDAAARAGVRHLVKLSWIAASEHSFVRSFGRWHAEVEDHLRASGVSYTILRASTFMQNYLPYVLRPGAQVIHSAAGIGKAGLVDARDVAAVAEACLVEPGHEGVTYEVTGPAALSNAEVAAIISRVTGHDVEAISLSGEELSSRYHRGGWPERWADELVAADEFQAQGLLELVTDVVERVGHKAPTTFEHFVREFTAPLAERRSA